MPRDIDLAGPCAVAVFARLWVEGQLLLDNWVEQIEKEVSGKIRLEGGRSYNLKLEYFYNGGSASAKLLWSSASQPKEPIGPTALVWTDGSARGLKGEYFQGIDLQRPWHTRNDPTVQFSWGTSPPFDDPKGEKPAALELDLPSGTYRAQWVDPRTGRALKTDHLRHSGGVAKLETPKFTEDIALRVTAK